VHWGVTFKQVHLLLADGNISHSGQSDLPLGSLSSSISTHLFGCPKGSLLR
jgi:hypothetical protein